MAGPSTTAFDILSRLEPDAVHACETAAEVCAFVADGLLRAHGLEEAPDEPTAVASNNDLGGGGGGGSLSSSRASNPAAVRSSPTRALGPRAYRYRPRDAHAARIDAAASALEPATDDGMPAEHLSLHCVTLFEDRQLICHVRRGGRSTIHRLAVDVHRFALDPASSVPPAGEDVYRLGRWDCRVGALAARLETHLLFRAVPALRPPMLVAELMDLSAPLLQKGVLACLDLRSLATAAGACHDLLAACRESFYRRPASVRAAAAARRRAEEREAERARRAAAGWGDDWERRGGGGYDFPPYGFPPFPYGGGAAPFFFRPPPLLPGGLPPPHRYFDGSNEGSDSAFSLGPRIPLPHHHREAPDFYHHTRSTDFWT